jgi:hypothetical protein
VANLDSSTVAVLRGNVNGTFTLLDPVPVGGTLGGPVSVAVGDIDIDGHPDIVTANEDDFSVSVVFGEGGGVFGNKLEVAVGELPQAVVVSDINLDGRPDLLVANTVEESDAVSILRGSGDRTLQEPENFLVGGLLPVSIATGDFNSDQRRDIATANIEDAAVGVSLLFNEASLVVGDTDTDGDLTTADIEQLLAELFDGDGANVITVAGGSAASGPGADGNADDSISAADIVAITTLVVGG